MSVGLSVYKVPAEQMHYLGDSEIRGQGHNTIWVALCKILDRFMFFQGTGTKKSYLGRIS